MALLEIPVRSDLPAYDFQIELEKVQYTLSFNWNARMKSWFMDIGDKDGNPLLSGLKMYASYPLKYKFKDTALPPGEFLLLDTTNQNKDPQQDDLGSRVILMYQESGTVE